MTERFASGATSISIDIQIVDDSGLGVTGLVAATFPATTVSAGTGADASVTLSDLSLLTSAYSSGGVKERGGGYYRFDFPNQGSDGCYTVRGEATGKHIICPKLQIGQVAAKLAAGDVSGNLPANTTQFGGQAVALDANNLPKVDVEDWKGAAAAAMTGDAYAYLGTNLGALGANATAIPTALLDLANGVETSLTLRQALRLIVAAAAGKLSGATTTTIVIRDTTDTKNRITATVDGNGNRTAITTDLT